MAAKTPVTTKSTAGYVDPKLGIYGGVATATNNLVSDVDEHSPNKNGLQWSTFYFGPSNSANDIDDGDTWASGIHGIKAVAWQPADSTDDLVAPTLTAAATGTITFQTTNTNNEGWLHVFHAS